MKVMYEPVGESLVQGEERERDEEKKRVKKGREGYETKATHVRYMEDQGEKVRNKEGMKVFSK